MSREGLGLAALKEGLWTEADVGRFLGVSRLALSQFLKDHGVEIPYSWEDLERERSLPAVCGLLDAVGGRYLPLNYLVLIGCIEVLLQLHRKVLIPSLVRRELLFCFRPG